MEAKCPLWGTTITVEIQCIQLHTLFDQSITNYDVLNADYQLYKSNVYLQHMKNTDIVKCELKNIARLK